MLCFFHPLREATLDIAQVFERSQFKNEVGAAIQTTPNATRLLDRWGFNFDTAGGTINNQVS